MAKPTPAVTRAFDRVAASLYLQEAYDLVNGLLFRLGKLEEARDRWLSAHLVANEQVGLSHDEFDRDTFNNALRDSGRAQSSVFDELEAFLAAWARLSLLFWPAPHRSSPLYAFALERGRVLRSFLQLDEWSPLGDRTLRDAWMHTDERFDDAWVANRLGNRQQFVRSKEVAAAVAHSVRVVDVESLTIYFRDKGGNTQSLPLLPLREALNQVLEKRTEAFRTRFHELPPHE